VSRVAVGWDRLWARLANVTGQGVVVGAMSALRADRRTGPQRVVVQGFGNVGRNAALAMFDAGHRIVAIADSHGTVQDPRGLDVASLSAITDATGVIDRSRLPEAVRQQPAAAQAWLDVDADVLVLAAQAWAIHSGVACRVRARYVIEGSNFGCSEDAAELLRRSGTVVIPGSVVNVGGAAVTGCVLTGIAPSDLPEDQLVAWLRDWALDAVARNCAALVDMQSNGSVDPVPALFEANRPR